MSVAYFAEPIDADRRGLVENGLRSDMVTALTNHGIAVYRPSRAWRGDAWSNAESVEAINRHALATADLVVARWPRSIVSVGVPMEIEAATAMGRLVILWTDRDDSVSLAGNPKVVIVRRMDEFEKVVANWVRLGEVKGDDRTPMNFSGPEGAMNRAHPGDAGFDLIVTEDTPIAPHSSTMVPCGTAIEFPPGVFGWVVARSSTFERYGVTILPGIIDTDFRGELYAVALNQSEHEVWVNEGSRIAQIVLLNNVAASVRPVRVAEVDQNTARGTNGFGSTGT